MNGYCPICNRPLCRTALGDSTDYEQRAKCYRIGYERLREEVNEQCDAKEVAHIRIRNALAALNGNVPSNPSETAPRHERGCVQGRVCANGCPCWCHTTPLNIAPCKRGAAP